MMKLLGISVVGAAIVGAGIGLQRENGQKSASTSLQTSDAGPLRFRDAFEALCVNTCDTAVWADTQEIDGRLIGVASAYGRTGILLAQAQPRRGRVPKADVIARFPKVGSGARLIVSFEFLIPKGYPANSVHLLDVECADCAEGGNPGIRVYLRHGRLRVDRSKIGIEHAWTNDNALEVTPDTWHRVDLVATMSADDDVGMIAVDMDGARVLDGQGRTLLPERQPGFDRLQFGITATSNSVPAAVMFDNFDAAITPRAPAS